jgi:hypothetical protein
MDKETVSELTKVLEIENAKLSELQKYIDGLFLCRKDYCDTKNCLKKSRILRSPTCEPTYVLTIETNPNFRIRDPTDVGSQGNSFK